MFPFLYLVHLLKHSEQAHHPHRQTDRFSVYKRVRAHDRKATTRMSDTKAVSK